MTLNTLNYWQLNGIGLTTMKDHIQRLMAYHLENCYNGITFNWR